MDTCSRPRDPLMEESINAVATSDACSIALGVTCSEFEQAYTKASNTEANDRFGWFFALSSDGNTLAVGAANEDSNATGVS